MEEKVGRDYGLDFGARGAQGYAYAGGGELARQFRLPAEAVHHPLHRRAQTAVQFQQASVAAYAVNDKRLSDTFGQGRLMQEYFLLIVLRASAQSVEARFTYCNDPRIVGKCGKFFHSGGGHRCVGAPGMDAYRIPCFAIGTGHGCTRLYRADGVGSYASVGMYIGERV